jgi:hypothetical protein
MNRLTEYYDGVESVEIFIKSTTDTKYYLPDIPGIKGKIIKRIIISHGTTTTPANRTILSDTNLRAAFITIINEKDTIIHRLPLYYLKRQFPTTPIANFIFNFVLTNTEKSYIEFSQSASLSTSESIFINFFYSNPVKKRLPVIPFLKQSLVNSYLEKSTIERIYPLQVEITDTTKTILKFPDDEFLRNKKVTSIKLYADVSELVAATLRAPDDKIIIANTIFNKSFLNLQLKNGFKINDLPLSLITSEFNLENEILFNKLEIDWPRCFIKIANITSMVANTVFFFLIHYSNED